ncbi:MAG: hypothetical protein Q9165_008842 [Trypethelium subeluteriae]
MALAQVGRSHQQPACDENIDNDTFVDLLQDIDSSSTWPIHGIFAEEQQAGTVLTGELAPAAPQAPSSSRQTHDSIVGEATDLQMSRVVTPAPCDPSPQIANDRVHEFPSNAIATADGDLAASCICSSGAISCGPSPGLSDPKSQANETANLSSTAVKTPDKSPQSCSSNCTSEHGEVPTMTAGMQREPANDSACAEGGNEDPREANLNPSAGALVSAVNECCGEGLGGDVSAPGNSIGSAILISDAEAGAEHLGESISVTFAVKQLLTLTLEVTTLPAKIDAILTPNSSARVKHKGPQSPCNIRARSSRKRLNPSEIQQEPSRRSSRKRTKPTRQGMRELTPSLVSQIESDERESEDLGQTGKQKQLDYVEIYGEMHGEMHVEKYVEKYVDKYMDKYMDKHMERYVEKQRQLECDHVGKLLGKMREDLCKLGEAWGNL